MRQLNQNLASVTGLLADSPDEVANAVRDFNAVVGEVQTFVADNRETLGTTSDKLAGVTQALHADSLDDVKQFLHVAPNSFQNYVNVYQPAQGGASAILAVNNFANPISFLCGAVQAASRLNAEQSRSYACSTWRRSSRTVSTTSRRSARTSSSAPRRGRTRSPTARSGCDPITFRRSHRSRRRRSLPMVRRPHRPPGPPLPAEPWSPRIPLTDCRA